MKEFVFLNGKFTRSNEAKVSVLDPGLLSGLGLFETMRAYEKKIVYFKEHILRIKKSSRLLGIDFSYTAEQIKGIILKTVKFNSLNDTYIRLTLWQGQKESNILITAKEYQPFSLKKYSQGFSACLAGLRQNEGSFLARIKTTNRLLYQLSLKEAQNKGFDEAIILNSRGFITEATRSNLFLVKDKNIFTPALSCGCLGGITRKVILDLAKKYQLKIYEGNFTLSDLFKTEEAFLTNSLMGVMPLTSIEKRIIGKPGCRRLTEFLIKKYCSLLK